MAYERIPEELKKLNQWGIFHKEWVEKRKKYTKIPLNPWNGGAGSSTNQETWSDFKTALRALDKYDNADGLAFYFANGYVGLDIDHIGDELEKVRLGDRDPENYVMMARELTKQTYMEVSLSGEGIHCIFKGKIPGNRHRKGNYEMYESGRFFALTGHCMNKEPGIKTLNDNEMKKLYEHYLGSDKIKPMPNVPTSDFKNDLSIAEIIEKAESSSTGRRFKLFMNGGWEEFYPSHSEADLAFANDLAFWTGRDFQKMDTIFRNSSLIRDKYDEKHGKTTYGIGLLNKAINETTETYNPHKKQKLKYDFSWLNNDEEDVHKSHSWDDTGNAERFMDRYGKIAKYSYIDRKWYIYNGSYWEMDVTGEIYKLIDSVVEDLKNEEVVIPADIADDEDKKEKYLNAWKKFKKTSRSHRSKENMKKELEHHIAVLHKEFDNEDMLLNTPSGYVDLTTGVLHDHDREKLFSKETNSEYTDNIDCPEWTKFLNQIFDNDQEMIHFIQKAVGYSLTGSVEEQVMFILLGNGRNGKSVFINTLSSMFGNYAKTMNVSSVMIRTNSGGANSDIARLEGSRLVISSEANEGSRLDESLIKQITGGDTVVARYQYGSEFEFNPKFKLWMATNHKPLIRGTDDGIWRRIILIPFKVQIPIEKVDKKLESKLKRELPGILNWAVQGAIDWQTEGLKLPETVREATVNYRNEMDVIELFIHDNCEVGTDYQAPAGELYRLYKEWATENNEYNMSKNKFGEEMKKKFERKRRASGNIYLGLKIKEDPRMEFLKKA